MHYAVAYGHEEVVKLLLDRGAGIDTVFAKLLAKLAYVAIY